MHATQVIMFPGLGASYTQMVQKFLAAHPGDAAVLADWSALVGVDIGGPVPHDPREAERQRQFEIHALNLLWWRRRRAELLAARPAVCGHSLGYYAALVAAGVVDEPTSLRLIDAAYAAGWSAFAEARDEIFVVTANVELDFDAELAGLGAEVLSENSPLQRTLCGPPGTLAAVRQRLEGRLLATSLMPTHIPFHSVRVRPACREFAATIAAMGIRPAPLQAPLWSHISARPVHDAAEALALVPEQLWQRVRWNQLIDALVQAGRFEFIEVGPNRILSQVVRWISPRLDVSFVDHFRRQGVQA